MLKRFIINLTPYGLVSLYKKRKKSKTKISTTQINIPVEEKIKQLYESLIQEDDNKTDDNLLFYERMVKDLIDLGLLEEQIRGGSIPFDSIKMVSDFIAANLSSKPINILHIGNYVGVSLAFLTKAALKYCGNNSLVISIDPNLTHRGTDNPNKYVNYLLAKYGLDKNSLILCGYSLEKSISNDGNLMGTDYDPFCNFYKENAPQNTIKNIAKIKENFIDLVMIDGNHEPEYLKKEIEQIEALLKNGSIIVLDDIDPKYWIGLYNMFQSLDKCRYQTLLTNDRIAILKYNVKSI